MTERPAAQEADAEAPNSATPAGRRAVVTTKEEAIQAAGRALANGWLTQAQMTPREQAEGAWTPTSRFTVDELEDLIRARRGMSPLKRG